MSENGMAERYADLGLAVGTPEIKSVGPIAFGPDGILFVADNASAAIFALGLGPAGPAPDSIAFEIEDLDARLASRLGCSRQDVSIRDIAVCPLTKEVYLSVMRGNGSDAIPVIAHKQNHEFPSSRRRFAFPHDGHSPNPCCCAIFIFLGYGTRRVPTPLSFSFLDRRIGFHFWEFTPDFRTLWLEVNRCDELHTVIEINFEFAASEILFQIFHWRFNQRTHFVCVIECKWFKPYRIAYRLLDEELC